MKHTLTLTRQADTQALYHRGGVADGKVDITEISWFMPQPKLAPEYLSIMRNIMTEKQTIPLFFPAITCEQTTLPQTMKHTWKLSVTGGIEKPRWIIIGLQTAKNSSQEQNPSVFDHCNLKNVYVTLNSERYPTLGLNTNFDQNCFMKLYSMADNFKRDYLGIDSLVGGTQINVGAYKTLFPIIVLDVTKQNERLKTGVVDMQVNFEFGANIPADTTAYAVIISDRYFKISSDGKNMSVVSM